MKKDIEFLIIGFTGPIGSGCTKLSSIISRIQPSGLIKKYYDNIQKKINKLSDIMNQYKLKIDIKDQNKNLEQLLETRMYLKEILKFNDPKFLYVSMSTMIIKKVIETITTPEFESWKMNNDNIAKQFILYFDKWKDTLHLYNDCKDFSELTREQLQQIDNMFFDFEELKKLIKNVEIQYLAESKINQSYLQFFGDNLRCNGNPFNSNNSIKDINKWIHCIAIETKTYIKFNRNRTENKSNCFLVDAFRNPKEVEYFRNRFTKFFLISLYADKKTRMSRVKPNYKNIDDKAFYRLFDEIDIRDSGENIEEYMIYKQNVSRCCYLSDIAINNNHDTKIKNLSLRSLRFFALMISPGCVSPSREELYMNLAYSLSLQSTCISRKVGAVITDKNYRVLGLGWNDVAKSQIGCGLRFKKDLIDSNIDQYAIGLYRNLKLDKYLIDLIDEDSFCFKDILSMKKIEEKIDKLKLSDDKKDEVKKHLNIKRLEFCRSLHAEENALIQVASNGGMGVKDGIIYTTTFPCELCAKKIYQSGINKIYYTEPYPNSISQDVFLKDGINNIIIEQFEGVKSFSYFKLFKQENDKKESQKIDKLIG